MQVCVLSMDKDKHSVEADIVLFFLTVRDSCIMVSCRRYRQNTKRILASPQWDMLVLHGRRENHQLHFTNLRWGNEIIVKYRAKSNPQGLTAEFSPLCKDSLSDIIYHPSIYVHASDNFPRLFLMELSEYQSKISQNSVLIPCLIQVKRQFDLASCQPAPSLALCSLWFLS